MGKFGVQTLIPLYSLCYYWFLVASSNAEENSYFSKAYNSIKWNNYDGRIRPYGENGTHESPTVIYVRMIVNYVDNIDESKMEFKTQLTLQMKWKDSRLVYDNQQGKVKHLTIAKGQLVWLPDVYFSNERTGYSHHIIAPNSFVKLTSDGDVSYSNRLSLTFTCPMNLEMYPLDLQICSVRLTSYGHTAEDFVLLWKQIDPVQIAKNLHVLKYSLEKIQAEYCSSNNGTVDFCCLKIDLFLRRELNFYLKYFYFPYVLIVFASWISFWLDRMIFIRLYITTSLLFIVIADLLFRSTAIPVSYTTALDVWIDGCILFVFLALLQNVFVACKVKKHFKRTTNAINLYTGAPLAKQEDLPEYLMTNAAKDQNKSPGCFAVFINKLKSKSVDTVCQILFPLGFVGFFIFYWMRFYFITRM